MSNEPRMCGDFAKLREACAKAAESAAEIMERVRHKDGLVFNTANYIAGIAKDALAAPSRNCDRFGGDPKRLHDEWWEWSGKRESCNEDGTVKMTYGEWLLAAIAKGANDGSK